MHILIIPSWYKTPKNPVKGTFFEEQARMFQKRGHQVGVLVPSHDLQFLGNSRFNNEKKPDHFNDKGIDTFYTTSQSFIPKVEDPTIFDIRQVEFLAYKVFIEYIRENGKPDIIHAHSVIWGGVVANYISKKENIPYFLTKHYTGWIIEPKRRESKSFRRLLQETILNSEKTFIVSSFYKNELSDIYDLPQNKLDVIPNIVNSIFSENKSIITMSNPVRLIIVAYLVERKNHIALFNALKKMKQKGFSIILDVVGNGSYENELQKYVEMNELSENIRFKGLLARSEVVSLVKESHIVVSASIFETFGVNIIEGLSMGRPCVVLDSGGPRDIMRIEDGVLFEQNTSEAFEEALEKVITNYGSYNQTEIANSCIDRFGEEVIYNKLMEYFLKREDR